MAKAYISEYSKMMRLEGSVYPPIADESGLITEYVVDFTAGEAHGANFDPRTMYIRVEVDAVCSIKNALSAVATTTNKRMVTGDREYFALGTGAGQGWRFSAISNT